MKTMAATVTSIIMMRAKSWNVLMAPSLPRAKRLLIAPGRPATMPAKMISDVPLPTPRAVICSPNHIRNMVPPTNVIMQEKRKK